MRVKEHGRPSEGDIRPCIVAGGNTSIAFFLSQATSQRMPVDHRFHHMDRARSFIIFLRCQISLLIVIVLITCHRRTGLFEEHVALFVFFTAEFHTKEKIS